MCAGSFRDNLMRLRGYYKPKIHEKLNFLQIMYNKLSKRNNSVCRDYSIKLCLSKGVNNPMDKNSSEKKSDRTEFGDDVNSEKKK
jgi:hypothetical protein